MALGKIDSERMLMVVLTVRKQLMRVISARDMSRKERRIYREELKPVPRFKSVDEEREFWAKHDSTDYANWRFRR